MRGTRVLVLLLVVLAIMGMYRAWWSFQVSNSPNESQFNLNVNKSAIQQDASQLKQDAQDAGNSVMQKVSPSSQPSTNP